MKKRIYLAIGFVVLLTTCLTVMSCGNDDEPITRQDISAPYGRWTLLGYVSDGNFVRYEVSGTRDCYLLLEEDGSYNARFCNLFEGEYAFCQNGEFRFLGGISTEMWSTNSNLMFMEEQLRNVTSYDIEGSSLKLYYSQNDYLKFSR